MRHYSVVEICNLIEDEYTLHSAADNIYIDKMSTPYDADATAMVFISPHRQDKQPMFDSTRAGVVICDLSIQRKSREKQCVIVVQDPKYTFAKIGHALFVEKLSPAIHPTAVIHPEAKIGANVYIGPHVYIGKCELKDHVVIHGNSYLYDHVTLHDHVIIHAGCILGADGLGHVRKADGIYQPFPHIGGVIIESGVSLGTHTCVARGALSHTIIKANAVIDSFVQIGHNVIIEENVLILSHVVIGGSSLIRKNALLAIGAQVCDYVIVGENAQVGPGVVIMQNVPAQAKVMPRAPITV